MSGIARALPSPETLELRPRRFLGSASKVMPSARSSSPNSTSNSTVGEPSVASGLRVCGCDVGRAGGACGARNCSMRSMKVNPPRRANAMVVVGSSARSEEAGAWTSVSMPLRGRVSCAGQCGDEELTPV